MNWDDLRIYLAIAREGSISGAARSLGVQHSTVSRRLRALEAQLGTRLLDRKKSGYELTGAGDNLLLAAEKMEQELLRVDGAVSGRDTRLKGQLRITAINNMASTVLMPFFAGFSQQYPEIELHISTTNNYVSLPQREADIAIRLTNTPSETLIGKRLTTVTSTVYGSKRYLERIKTTGKSPEWLGIECCEFHRAWTQQARNKPHHRFYSDDTLLTRAALKQDQGLAYLPCFLGDTDPEFARYCKPDPQLNLGLWLLFHPDLRHNARVLAFRDYLSSELKTQQELFNR
ncbi:MAG: LysR family transcriptional regulator [Thiotrichales bacterium]